MGPRSDNRGYVPTLESCLVCVMASMGPRSDNRGYGRRHLIAQSMSADASMGPRSDNRGYGRMASAPGRRGSASMGPRSDNRGYAARHFRSDQPCGSFNGSTVR